MGESGGIVADAVVSASPGGEVQLAGLTLKPPVRKTPALFVAGLHDARPRSAQFGQLCPELRLEPFVFEGEPCRRAGRFEQASSLEQRRVVQERRDRRVRWSEHRHGTVRA
jgi:hypothetical protein